MTKTVLVLEVSNATEEQMQIGLGKAFADFCKENKGTGITANVLKEDAAEKVIGFINEVE